MKCVTIDQALKTLEKAKRLMGGDKVLILSLTGSGLECVNVNNLKVINDPEDQGTYVEVRAKGFEGLGDHVIYRD